MSPWPPWVHQTRGGQGVSDRPAPRLDGFKQFNQSYTQSYRYLFNRK
jgi:hypothetical protein